VITEGVRKTVITGRFRERSGSVFRFLLIALAIVATAGLAWAGPQEPGSVSSDSLKAASPGTPSQHVKRAVFTTGVVEREPADEIAALKTDVGKVFFFTEIVGMEGKTIIHRWVYNGETKADVSFQIGGAKWRVYSSKTLIPEWAGAWTVEVVDGEGNTLHKATLAYEKTP
jgi:hypothetical protein